MPVTEKKLKFKHWQFKILLDELNERNMIDQINDELLSKQVFSTQMHTDVVRCSFKRSKKLQKLLTNLESCPEHVLPTFLKILDELEMNIVTKKLRRNPSTGTELFAGRV